MARACLRRRDELDLFVNHVVNGAGQPWGESRSTWRNEIRRKMQAHPKRHRLPAWRYRIRQIVEEARRLHSIGHRIEGHVLLSPRVYCRVMFASFEGLEPINSCISSAAVRHYSRLDQSICLIVILERTRSVCRALYTTVQAERNKVSRDRTAKPSQAIVLCVLLPA